MELYDIYLIWNPFEESESYRIYCCKTLINLLEYTDELAVKVLYEAIETGRSLLKSTTDYDEAIKVRDELLALEIECVIGKVDTKKHKG
jgi:hypothetical protein